MTTANGKVALVGAGYWGKNLARNFAEIGALEAIVDNDAATAKAVSQATGASVRSLSDVLSDPSIDGLAIATSAPTHVDIGLKALDAGKHIFVEKPLALDAEGAQTLIDKAAASDRVLMVGHLLRYHPVFQKMLEIVQSGSVGSLRFVHSDRMSLGKFRVEENVLWSFAPHDTSMVLALAGETPDKVSAQAGDYVTPDIADIAMLQLAFPSGIKASIRCSWLHHRKVQQIVAVCESGFVVFDDAEPDWSKKLAVHHYELASAGGAPVPQRGETEYVDVPKKEPLKEECRHFIRAIESNGRPLTDGDEGRAVVEVLQRATLALGER